MTEQQAESNKWTEIVRDDPAHSHRYVERFRTMKAEGHDLAGEARLIDALAPRSARVLDAGCGPGRVGAFLHTLGHTVVGVDLDPVLVVAANRKLKYKQTRVATVVADNACQIFGGRTNCYYYY